MGLDVIIPVYNEGENIRGVLDSLGESVKTPLNILICYDNDDDNTLEELKSYPRDKFRILTIKNRGTGVHGAILTGFKESCEEAVLVMPADDTYNASIIDDMYRKFTEGNDIVAASRFMPGGCMEGAPLLKNILVRCAAFTLYYIARLPVHDPSNGFRLFSRAVIFRPHNVYGPDMGTEHVVPQSAIRMKALVSKNKGPIRFPIQGTGEETRAFVFIDDFIDGLMKVIEKGEHLNIYNIGTSEEVTINKIIYLVAEYYGKKIEIIPGKLSAGSTSRRCPDITKLKKLGYAPSHALRDGIFTTVKWYDENAGL